MTTETRRLNDVDLETVGKLIASIQQEPHKANTKWSAIVEWDGGFASKVKVREHDYVLSDEPPKLGGTDTAINPVEQLLGAYGNCLAVGYAANATAAGVELNGVRIELEGDIDLHTFLGLRDGHAGYQDIRVKVHIDSDADPSIVEELHHKVLATSPVGHTLSRPVALDVTLV